MTLVLNLLDDINMSRKLLALSFLLAGFITLNLTNKIAEAAPGDPCSPNVPWCTQDRPGVWTCQCGYPCDEETVCAVAYDGNGDPEGYECMTPTPSCEQQIIPEDCNEQKALRCGEDGGCSSNLRRCEGGEHGTYSCVDNPGECAETCDSLKVGGCGDYGGCNSDLRQCQETDDNFYECVKDLMACYGVSGECDETSVGQCGELGGCLYESYMCLSIVEHGITDYYCDIPTPEQGECLVDELECGMPGTDGQCGSDGGCPPRFRCDGENEICFEDGIECTDPVCSPLNECGPNNGCGAGEMCKRQGDGPHYCVVEDECLKTEAYYNQYGGPPLTLQELINLIYGILLPIAVGLGVYFTIRAGYTIKTSEGDPAKKKQGFEELLAALTGTAFVGVAFTILKIILDQIVLG